MIVEQEQAIMTGIALGIESLQSDQYLDAIVGGLREPLLKDKNVRVKNIMVVDDAGNVPTTSFRNSIRANVKTKPRVSFSSRIFNCFHCEAQYSLPTSRNSSPPGFRRQQMSILPKPARFTFRCRPTRAAASSLLCSTQPTL